MNQTTRTIEAEGINIQDAREKMRAKLSSNELVVDERVLQDGEAQTVKAAADTTADTFALAEQQVPKGAKVIEKKETISPFRKQIEIDAFDEGSAVAKVTDLYNGNVTIKSIKLTTPGKKGILGIGNKPNTYTVDVLRQSSVEISYQEKAKILCEVGSRDKLKNDLKSGDETERIRAADALLKKSDRADRLEAANAIRDHQKGLLTLFNALWIEDEVVVKAISDILWHSLWQVARTKGSQLPPMQASLAQIDDPREQLAHFSNFMAGVTKASPSMAAANALINTDLHFQLQGFQIVVEGLVKDIILEGRNLGPGHMERVRLMMDQVFCSEMCKAFQSGRCVVRQVDTGPCTWNPKDWKNCNVVKENQYFHT
ncbi:MAG: hypothetical protein EHM70_07345 [Chloroflexota bacterium]|nr:MAG: hypothetical protein EHM70_07345 [Chloroflexota bacterium]